MFEGDLKRHLGKVLAWTMSVEVFETASTFFTHLLTSSFNSHMMPNIWKASISVPGPLNLQAQEVLDQSLLHGHEMTSGEEPRSITASDRPPCTLSTNFLGG